MLTWAHSQDSGDKLQAVVNHRWPDESKDFPETYIDACRQWYAGLSDSERVAAVLAAAQLSRGDEREAEKIAAELPPAPVCPLI